MEKRKEGRERRKEEGRKKVRAPLLVMDFSSTLV